MGVIMTANCLRDSAVAQLANSKPRSPATIASTTHSVVDCRMRRQVPPPSARRMTNSRRLPSDRASIRLVKFAHATRSTRAVIAERIISGRA